MSALTERPGCALCADAAATDFPYLSDAGCLRCAARRYVFVLFPREQLLQRVALRRDLDDDLFGRFRGYVLEERRTRQAQQSMRMAAAGEVSDGKQ